MTQNTSHKVTEGQSPYASLSVQNVCKWNVNPYFFCIYDKKVCQEGQYGQRCSFRCGNCLDEEPCHHINGTCVSGCSPGWKGEMCDQSEFLNHCH